MAGGVDLYHGYQIRPVLKQYFMQPKNLDYLDYLHVNR
jgi:hypothetical protein